MSLYVRYYPLISNDAPIFLGHLGTIPIISLYLLDHCCCSRHTSDGVAPVLMWLLQEGSDVALDGATHRTIT